MAAVFLVNQDINLILLRCNKETMLKGHNSLVFLLDEKLLPVLIFWLKHFIDRVLHTNIDQTLVNSLLGLLN